MGNGTYSVCVIVHVKIQCLNLGYLLHGVRVFSVQRLPQVSMAGTVCVYSGIPSAFPERL